ncbi:M48 family metalloprotease [Pontibacter fetidus]|uniref:M48 family metalloprotease n=1 Tax=Pontibacter fetidus TaxID=2700082 RepID=A0A6B2GWD1_9BACT|nr:M48 family metalloprotease [Pontibacter fetidus]NDK54293.1 M48 family metalloprotease [Pontibacter fetidus]
MKLKRTLLTLSLAAVSAFTLYSCGDDGVLLFTIEDDVALGAQVAHEVDSTYKAQGKLLERNATNQQAYIAMDRIVNRVLNSGQVQYRDEFTWDVKIIKDDAQLNAFATPGGHIYVFTGLIKYLSDEDHFAGVIAHEIAHADHRHSVKQLQRSYGINLLLSIALGNNPSALKQIAGQLSGTLAGLKFSRDAETEADNYSVEYLGGTNYYACDGAAGFFIKMNEEAAQGTPPEFLSTHPNPENRVQNIEQKAKEEGCSVASGPDNDFNALKSALKL